jgi:MFS family permease
MFTLLRRRDFSLLWFASLISQVGDWVLIAALPFYVYVTTRSTLASGATFLASNLPTILFGSAAGVLVDRWDRKRLIVFGEIAQGVVLLLLLLVQSEDALWLVYVVAFAESSIAILSSPAFQAAIPHTVEEGWLIRANGLLSAGQNVARLIGPPIAGLLMAVISLPGVVVLDAASFFISGALMTLLAAPLQDIAERSKAADAEGGIIRAIREWWSGLQIAARERWVAVLFIVPALSLLGDGMFTSLLAPFVNGVLGGSALVFGWILTVRGLGGLAGGVVLGTVTRRIKASRIIGPAVLLMGGVLLAMVLLASIPAMAGAMFLGGIAAICIFVNISSLLQQGIPDRFRGRVFALYSTVSALAVLSGNILGSLLGDVVGISHMLEIAASLNVVAGIIAFTMLRGATAARAEQGLVAVPDAAEYVELQEISRN